MQQEEQEGEAEEKGVANIWEEEEEEEERLGSRPETGVPSSSQPQEFQPFLSPLSRRSERFSWVGMEQRAAPQIPLSAPTPHSPHASSGPRPGSATPGKQGHTTRLQAAVEQQLGHPPECWGVQEVCNYVEFLGEWS